MTERWAYVVALPLRDYYDDETWWRVFPPDEVGMGNSFDAEEFRQMIKRWESEGTISAKWVDAPNCPCPECRKVSSILIVSYEPNERGRAAQESIDALRGAKDPT